MARASTVVGLTMLGAAGVGAATIPFMGSPSVTLRCDANRFPTMESCQAAGHPICRPDGTTANAAGTVSFVPANCSTGTGSGGTSRWYNTHPIYWFGSGHGGTTTTARGGGSAPQSVTSTSRGGGSTTTTGGGTSSRGGFGSSGTSHGGSSSS